MRAPCLALGIRPIFDDAFRITGIVDGSNPALSQTYGYDNLDRLISTTGTGVSQSWTYDANGNRLAQGGSAASSYTISSSNNRITSISGALVHTYTYDAAGSTTADGSAIYAYDDAGRMVSAAKAGITGAYSTNGLGQRVRKTVGGASTHFVYDESGRIAGEHGSGGALMQETVWFDGIPVATLRPTAAGGVDVFYVHTDHLNTPRRISRSSDNVIVWRWDSDPFGSTTAGQDPDGDGEPFVYALRFPGQYADGETGLNYNYFRDYDPYTGRYVQSDPIGLLGGINTYAYVFNDPVGFIDPYGLSRSTIDAAIENAARRGSIRELEALLEASNPTQAAAIRSALQRLTSKAEQIIAKECRGSINREFPSELRQNTLQEIMDSARGGDSVARKALKLLNDSRFKK